MEFGREEACNLAMVQSSSCEASLLGLVENRVKVCCTPILLHEPMSKKSLRSTDCAAKASRRTHLAQQTPACVATCDEVGTGEPSLPKQFSRTNVFPSESREEARYHTHPRDEYVWVGEEHSLRHQSPSAALPASLIRSNG